MNIHIWVSNVNTGKVTTDENIFFRPSDTLTISDKDGAREIATIRYECKSKFQRWLLKKINHKLTIHFYSETPKS